jgi:hypothetical protein
MKNPTFDTVDHRIPDDVLRRRFGVCGSALDWQVDFLRDRTQIVRAGGSETAALTLKYGVSLGSVNGPKRFIRVHRGCHMPAGEVRPGPSSVRGRHAGNAALSTS